MTEQEFQIEIQKRILSDCNMAPDLTYVDPVHFSSEWEKKTGLGGYFYQLYQEIRARKNRDDVTAKRYSEEMERLFIKSEESVKYGKVAELLRYDRIAAPLAEWFSYHARILKWRMEPLPYYVWVSEIMLQQTRVEAVKGYFDRFTDRLPDIPALAECPEEELLKLWEGLGYYNRVRNMQKCAKIVMEEYGGELPDSVPELLKLPGIGSYTAGAIVSIAYGKPAAAVDGNVLRVTKRLAESSDDITKATVKKEMEEIIQVVSKRASERGISPSTFTQSLMELGAVVCIPVGKPLCDECPLNVLCKMAGMENWKDIPNKPAKKKRKVEERTIFLLVEEKDGKYYYGIRKREQSGLLAGLWELPGESGKMGVDEAEKYIKEHFKVDILQTTPIPDSKHIFSHIEWHMKPYLVRISGAATDVTMEEEAVIEERYSLPSAFQKIWKERNRK